MKVSEDEFKFLQRLQDELRKRGHEPSEELRLAALNYTLLVGVRELPGETKLAVSLELCLQCIAMAKQRDTGENPAGLFREILIANECEDAFFRCENAAQKIAGVKFDRSIEVVSSKASGNAAT